MATYLNDLRLTELATGEGSGTWGTTTNLSLELIGEALGFATQQVFGSDADATTTIADGASDPARAMYFKITSAGSLTATRTCTIAPNTISRVMFIENATTGSQSIQISQGSGASVTILTGKTAVVYLDGAGATAAVVDAMAGVDPGVTDTLTEVLVAGNTSGGTNIELSTTDKVQFRDAAIYINSSVDGQLDIVADTEIQIAATTVDLNGNLDVSGTALVTGVLTTTAATVFNGGFASNADSTLGTDKKVQFRDSAIYINSSVDGQLDIVADTEIQIAATTIDINGAINASGEIIAASLDISGDIDVDGTSNLDILDVDGAANFAADVTLADGADLITASAGTSNLRLGANAGNSIIAGGNYNTVVGDEAGTAITTGDYNVALGYLALPADTLGSRSTAIGVAALEAQNFTSATDAYNTAVGFGAGSAVTTATRNTLIGGLTGDAITTGSFNVAVGYTSLGATTTGVSNVALGDSALNSNTTGSTNTAVGQAALGSNTTADDNTAVGYSALTSNTTGGQNTALGVEALKSNTTASYNTAIGRHALYLNTTGAGLTAVGHQALNSNTTGNDNVAVGGYSTSSSIFAPLYDNTTGSSNVGIGVGALRSNTTADSNTAVGYQAGYSNTTGAQSVFVGQSAGYTNTTGTQQVFVGLNAGYSTTGNYNTFVGAASGYSMSTGAKNTIIGSYNGNQGGLDIRTASNHIVLSDGDGNPRGIFDASGRFGINVTPSSFGSPMLAVEQTGTDWIAYTRNSSATPYGLFVKYTATPNNTSSYFLRCDDGTTERFNIGSNGNVYNFTGAAIGTISDVRLKENITPATPKLADILKVEIINYNRIGSEQKLLGVKAHQLKEVFPSLVDTRDTREYDDEGCVVAGFEDELHVKVGFDFATYTKCFQEQQAIIEALTARIEALEGAN
jgi:hypothetical protein